MSDFSEKYPLTTKLFGPFYKSLSDCKNAFLYVDTALILSLLFNKKEEDKNFILDRYLDGASFTSSILKKDTSTTSRGYARIRESRTVKRIPIYDVPNDKVMIDNSSDFSDTLANLGWDDTKLRDFLKNAKNKNILKRAYLPDNNYNFIMSPNKGLFRTANGRRDGFTHNNLDNISFLTGSTFEPPPDNNSFYIGGSSKNKLNLLLKQEYKVPLVPKQIPGITNMHFYYIPEKNIIKNAKYIELIMNLIYNEVARLSTELSKLKHDSNNQYKTAVDQQRIQQEVYKLQSSIIEYIINYINDNLKKEVVERLIDEKTLNMYSRLIYSCIFDNIGFIARTCLYRKDNKYFINMPTLLGSVIQYTYAIFNVNLYEVSKIGRIVRNTFNKEIKDEDIGYFTDILKRKFDAKYTGKYDIEEVSGNLIPFYYQYIHYSTFGKGPAPAGEPSLLNSLGGTLFNSCMRHIHQSRIFTKIYADNPETISMLILKNIDDDLLSARALIFTDEDRNRYIGRIFYSKSDCLSDVFTYCSRNGIRNMSAQNLNIFGERIKCNIKLKKYNYSMRPYLDDFEGISEDGYLYFRPFRTVSIHNNNWSEGMQYIQAKNNLFNSVGEPEKDSKFNFMSLYSEVDKKFINELQFNEYNFMINDSDKKIDLLPKSVDISLYCNLNNMQVEETLPIKKYNNEAYILSKIKPPSKI